jgi:hypothetical protein
MTRDDVNAKLDAAAQGVLSSEQSAFIRDQWWEVASIDDISRPIRSMVGFGA